MKQIEREQVLLITIKSLKLSFIILFFLYVFLLVYMIVAF